MITRVAARHRVTHLAHAVSAPRGSGRARRQLALLCRRRWVAAADGGSRTYGPLADHATKRTTQGGVFVFLFYVTCIAIVVAQAGIALLVEYEAPTAPQAAPLGTSA
jgi:hypothetical protein